MSKSQETPTIPLPRGWKQRARTAVLHVLSLAKSAAAYTGSWAADRLNTLARPKTELEWANQELLLCGAICIRDARLAANHSDVTFSLAHSSFLTLLSSPLFGCRLAQRRRVGVDGPAFAQ